MDETFWDMKPLEIYDNLSKQIDKDPFMMLPTDPPCFAREIE